MDVLKIKEILKKNVSEKRYIHILNVAETAKKLAIHYSEDEKKSEIAALLHDVAKNFKKERMLKLIKEKIPKIYSSKALLHSLAGAMYARNIFKIEDKDILNAIKYHTYGREKMTILEKIIYISDTIEPNRDYDGIEKIREEAFRNLDLAIFYELNHKIKYLIENNMIIHINTINMRNEILENLKLKGINYEV